MYNTDPTCFISNLKSPHVASICDGEAKLCLLKSYASTLCEIISDRVRLLLLRDFGGVYCDVDAMPVRPFDVILRQLGPQHTFFSGLKPSQGNNTLYDCTVYGSAPNSRIINECLSVYDRINWAHGCKTFSDKIIQKMGPDVAGFGYEHFYNWEINDKTIVLHDVLETRLFSWVDEEDKAAGALAW